MTTCELIPQAVQQFGGIVTRAENLAIVPDIHSYSFVGNSTDLQPCKRNRASASDCLSSIEDELDLGDFTFPEPEPKRQCRDYSVTPSPNQFQNISSPDSIEEFALEVKGDYKFTGNKDVTGIFTFGGNSPASSSSSLTDFTQTNTQASAGGCQQDFNLQFPSANLFNMHRPSQTALSHPLAQQHADKYELIITEQPEEVRIHPSTMCLHSLLLHAKLLILLHQ